jgi:uncharacterized membrane protein YoaK (UPF0700 family)
MFRHQGKSRTYNHNLRLASVLSFVAGIVNITGVLSVKTLTTNVTGHFAYFSEEFGKRNYAGAFFYLFFIISFLLGAFVSNLLVEIVSKRRPAVAYIGPMLIEILILIIIAFEAGKIITHPEQIACILLFAMGLQNALVTKVSQSVVRTTHLTGLFTDLGIELSQLFFYRKPGELLQLSKSISLKLAIIGFFFTGCIAGGFLYGLIGLKTLLFAGGCLLTALFYDTILFHYYYIKRKVNAYR